MGGVDKSQLIVEGERIIDRQLRVLRECCAEVAMVCPALPPELHDVTRLDDRVGGLGPVDGLAAALRWSASPWLLAVASDMPFVSAALVETLWRKRAGASMVAARVDGRVQPLFALYRRELSQALDELLRKRELRLSSVLESPPTGAAVHWVSEQEVLAVDPNLLCFRNINRVEDLLTPPTPIE